jgi:hypothetical protein
MINKRDNSSSLPGLGETLKLGFEFTSRRMWLLVLPIVVDVFFWLGPRLSLGNLAQEWITWWQAQLDVLGSAETAALVQPELFDQVVDITTQFNLMSQLSVPFLGIPTLMGGIVPEKTPIMPQVTQIATASSLLNILLVISIAGLIVSGIYFGLIAYAVRGDGDRHRFGRKLPKQTARLIGLAIALLLLIMILYIPVTLVSAVLALLSPALLSAAVLVTIVAIFWLLLFLGFTLPGLFIDDLPILKSVRNSVRFVRFHMNTALPLLILIYIINSVMSLVWLSADNGSWLTFVSIFGHAFVSTALVVATFIFYRDRHYLPSNI